MQKKTEKLVSEGLAAQLGLRAREESEFIDLALPGNLPDVINPGDTLGNYLILNKLGEGGMGMVFKAHDPILDRMVALKVISPHLFRNQEYLERFRVEAQAQARLNSPNIVTLHSMFQLPAWLVLVMEYVEGETLAQRLHNKGRLTFANAIWLFEQALLGVDRAHRMGVIHRDLKPGNIFITTGNEIKLMDFGVARMVDNKSLTMTGSMIGTLTYIPPEQINGKEADFRSDIYTIGITLYESIVGRPPFEYRTDFELMNAHLHEEPPRPAILQPDIPEDLESVVLRAIEKDPDKRYQTAREFRNALLRVGITRIKAYEHLKRRSKQSSNEAHPAEENKSVDEMLENYLENDPPPKLAARKPIIPASASADNSAMPFSMFPQRSRNTEGYSVARSLLVFDQRAARRRFYAALALYGLVPPVVIALIIFTLGLYPNAGEEKREFFDFSSITGLWNDLGASRWLSGESASAGSAPSTSGEAATGKAGGLPPASATQPTAGSEKESKYDALRKAWR